MRRSAASHVSRALVAVPLLCVLSSRVTRAQAPLAGGLGGSWIEASALSQSVTNGYGNWQGMYARAVRPSTMSTYYLDALALRAFGERGAQIGATARHDVSPHVFFVLGGSVGSGAPIMPRARADGSLGLRFGQDRRLQATVGLSYVKSVTTLSDVAGVASLAWYAPHALVFEGGVRYNVSRPGDIRSHRFTGATTWTPSPKRSFSLRAIGGSEGWQVINTTTTLQRFNSHELSVAWREKVSSQWALNAQLDQYSNPFYTRSGVTLGVARYW